MIIKRCPFCGWKARLLSWRKGKCKYVIGCSNPLCVMWLPKKVAWKERFNYTSGAWAIKNELIATWNKRFGEK